MRILLSGAAGFIGSHVALDLIEKGYDVVCVDNFSNAVEGCSIKFTFFLVFLRLFIFIPYFRFFCLYDSENETRLPVI